MQMCLCTIEASYQEDNRGVFRWWNTLLRKVKSRRIMVIEKHELESRIISYAFVYKESLLLA